MCQNGQKHVEKYCLRWESNPLPPDLRADALPFMPLWLMTYKCVWLVFTLGAKCGHAVYSQLKCCIVLSLVGAMQFFCPHPSFVLINPFCLLFVITLVEACSLRLACKPQLNIKPFAVVFTLAFQQEDFWKDLQVINQI